MEKLLLWLQNYYLECCDGDWEHDYGIKVRNIDNPGWAVEIDLIYTRLDGQEFEEVRFDRSENDWIICKVENNKFKGYGGPRNLIDIITVFKEWSESDLESDQNGTVKSKILSFKNFLSWKDKSLARFFDIKKRH